MALNGWAGIAVFSPGIERIENPRTFSGVDVDQRQGRQERAFLFVFPGTGRE